MKYTSGQQAERALHSIIKRNATEDDEERAQVIFIGTPFQADGHCYRVTSVKRDSLKRLLLISTMEG